MAFLQPILVFDPYIYLNNNNIKKGCHDFDNLADKFRINLIINRNINVCIKR